MTSLLSSYKLGNTLPNPTNCLVLTYNDGTNEIPVPFIFDRRTSTLDIQFSTGGFSDSTSMTENTKYFRGQTFGTLYTIESIGPNFIDWLQTFIGADAGSVTIYEKPIIVPANVVQVDKDPSIVDAMTSSNTPISFEIANGSLSNDYYATYLFKKPLVVRYTIGGTPTWRAFLTQF